VNFFTSWLLKVLFNYRTGHITITSTLNLILQNVGANSEAKCDEVGISFLFGYNKENYFGSEERYVNCNLEYFYES
jgi:hypothetical protein